MTKRDVFRAQAERCEGKAQQAGLAEAAAYWHSIADQYLFGCGAPPVASAIPAAQERGEVNANSS
jgi:hypothetical protein